VIIAHENVRKRLSEDKYLEFWDKEHPAFPGYALPEIVFTDRMTMHFNGEKLNSLDIQLGQE
jgi:cyclase